MTEAPLRVATDPLGAIRVELVNAARRRTAARIRRRRLAAVALTLVATLAFAAAAGALIGGGTTGMPTLDRLLAKGEFIAPYGSRFDSDITPAEHPNPSTPVEVESVHGDEITLIPYMSHGGSICTVLQEPHGEGAGEAREGWGCIAPATLSRGLAGSTAYVGYVQDGRVPIVSGYTVNGVSAFELTGPGGPFTVELGDRWLPTGDEDLRVRPFLAVGRGDLADALPPNVYSFAAHLDDGRNVEVRPSARAMRWRGG